MPLTETGQVPETSTDSGQAPQTTGQVPAEDVFDADRAKALIDKLRPYEKQAKQLERELAELRQAEDLRKRTEMTELERIKADLEAERQARAQAEQRQRDQLIRTQVITAAARAGFNDPEDAFRMLDVSALEADESGKVGGLDSALQALAKSKPYLVKSSGTISPTNPSGGPQKASDEQLRKEMFGTRKTPLFEGGGVFQVEK